MKKIIKLMTIIIVVSTFVVTGCGKKNNKVVEHDTSKEVIESNEDIGNATLIDTQTYDDKEHKINVIFKLYGAKNDDEEATGEFAIVKGYDSHDKLIWSYKTDIGPAMQNEIYELLGGYDGKVFVREYVEKEEKNYINVLDASTGKSITKIDGYVNPRFIGGASKIDTKTSESTEYLFFMDQNILNMGCTKIGAYDIKTLKLVKIVTIDNFEYADVNIKVVDGAPTDKYISFKYVQDAGHKFDSFGFFVTEILKDNFNIKNYTK